MTSEVSPGAGSAAWTARRVEVYAVLAAQGGGPVLLPGAGGRVPGVVLGHGEHPRDAARRALALVDGAAEGLRLVGVRSDVRPVPIAEWPDGPGLHVLRLVFVAEHPERPDHPERPEGAEQPEHPAVPDAALLRDPLVMTGAPVVEWPPGAPPRVQRPAAYAVVVRDGEVLLSRVTGLGVWTLPGGGVDHGEHPDDAVRRETFEETGLDLVTARLVDVDSRHFTGRGPDQVLEDFHGVRILYHGEVAERREPVVQEVGGSTDAAAWFPLEEVRRLRLADVVRTALRLER